MSPVKTIFSVSALSTGTLNNKLTTRAIEELLIRFRLILQWYDDALHPLGHTLARILFQLLLPFLIRQAWLVDGLYELAIAQYGTACQIPSISTTT